MSSNIKSVHDPEVVKLLSGAANRVHHPSPLAWEDQLLYFLLPDRFSNNKETGFYSNDGTPVTAGSTPTYTNSDRDGVLANAREKKDWLNAGGRFVGGTIKGVITKLGYLKRLGVTAIWIGPIFKQIHDHETYHGYAVQNFMDVDPRFGTIEDLKDLVATAHKLDIYVLLDIIVNHTGDVFRYKKISPLYNGKHHEVTGFFDVDRRHTIPFKPIDESVYPNAFPNAAVWPAELQSPEAFTRKGRIRDDHWDDIPECVEGDFMDLKDINLGDHDPEDFEPTEALKTMCDVYKYWIAVTDIDGFRIDTVKHMGFGPTRYFASSIHEFTQSIGKHNFLLIGEITGGRAFETVEITGIDAALGIGDLQKLLWRMPKGQSDPAEYFNLFRNALYLKKGSHTWFRSKVVTMIDDHDQIWRGGDKKGRFCAEDSGDKLILAALALNLCTLGIPCIYYGSEQSFDGGGASDPVGRHWADQFIREAMFGGGFGPFRTTNKHCFDEHSRTYSELARITALRAQEVCLRRGRQYLRDISSDGTYFAAPSGPSDNEPEEEEKDEKDENEEKEKKEKKAKEEAVPVRTIIAWSRLFVDEEILCAINTDPSSTTEAYVTVDHDMHPEGSPMLCLYPKGTRPVRVHRIGKRAAVWISIPPGGFVMYKGRANHNGTGRPSTR